MADFNATILAVKLDVDRDRIEESVIKAQAGLIAPPRQTPMRDPLAKPHTSTSAVLHAETPITHEPLHTSDEQPRSLSSRGAAVRCRCMTASGFLPLMTYSALSAALPLVHVHAPGWDFGDTAVRLLHVFLAAVLATLLVLANSPVVLYNMLLFFHIGVETTVVASAIAYASIPEKATRSVVLAWFATGCVILHLLPFLLVDAWKVLVPCASLGVVLNAMLTIYVIPEWFLLLVASSSALLTYVLAVVVAQGRHPSLFTAFRMAWRGSGWIRFRPYEWSVADMVAELDEGRRIAHESHQVRI